MQIKGKLNLSRNNDDYIMFYNGRVVNLTELLNTMLLENVFVKVDNDLDKVGLFYESGKLVKDKVSLGYYLYHINSKNLDEVLWNNVGRRLSIEIKNITKS